MDDLIGEMGNPGDARADEYNSASPMSRTVATHVDANESGEGPHNAGATLLSILRSRAASDDGERTAFTFLTQGAGEAGTEEVLTFATLERRARSIAAALQQHCARGERALIACAPGLDYIVAFYGCVMAGIVAVPAYPPRDARHMW